MKKKYNINKNKIDVYKYYKNSFLFLFFFLIIHSRLNFYFFFFFFFFKQKTAYEISVRDWSSDVCSSDLPTSWHGWRRSGSPCAGSSTSAIRGQGPTRKPGNPIPSSKRDCLASSCRGWSGSPSGPSTASSPTLPSSRRCSRRNIPRCPSTACPTASTRNACPPHGIRIPG